MELRKPKWNERAKETERFHKLKVAADKNWTIKKTAAILDRSYGSVAEDLLLASWLNTHPRVVQFKTAYEALRWIRNTKYSIRTRL